MTFLNRLLLVLVMVELVVSVILVQQQLTRVAPVLPQVEHDDPLLKNDLQQLANQTQSGMSSDWYALGEGLLGQGFYGEAELAFRRAVELNPQNAMAQFGLAFCLDRTGRTSASTPEYLKAADLARDSQMLIGSWKHSLYQMGKNYLRESNEQAALETFEKNREFGPASYQYAKLLIRSNRVDEALPVLDTVLSKAPNSLKFNSLLYQAMDSTGQTEKAWAAAQMLERSEYFIPADLNTNYVKPLSQKIGFNHKMEEYNKLLTTQQMDLLEKKLLSLWKIVEPTTLYQKTTILMSMAEVAFQQRKPDAIFTAVQQLKDLGISSADMLQLEGAAHALNDELDQAAELWLRASKMSPNIPLHQMLAKYYDQQNDSTNRDLQLGQAALLKVKSLYWSNQLQPAKKAAEEALQHDPQLDQAWFYLGEIESALAQPDAAMAAYRKCVALNPNHGRALTAIQRQTN